MKIKSLQLFGFKSFADRTELVFDRQIVGVVGPNGCGKSNIVDAIRWVMGEQSAKGLRGTEMADVIFNGTTTRKKSAFAEVNLTFDNADRSAPAPYTDCAEVMISRRLFRTGESEYLINKVPVRLKDITDLFLGTGSSARAYSIVAQGKVDQIVLAKPEDRRFLLEEAAGVAKYKARKVAAERKMEGTRQNLDRVHDIIQELERSARHLDRQVERAEQFRKIQNELRQIDEQIVGFKISRLDRLATSNAEHRTQSSMDFERVSAQFSEIEARIEQFRLEALNQEKASSSDYEALLRQKENFSQADKEVELSTQRIQLLKNQIEERKKDVERLLSKSEANKISVQQVLHEQQTLESQREKASTELQELKTSVNEAEMKIQSLETERRTSQVRIDEIRTQSAREAQRREMMQSERVNLELERAEVEQSAEQGEKQERQIRGDLTGLEDRLRQLESRLSNLEAEISGIEKNRSDATAQQSHLQEERTQVNQLLAQVEAQIKSVKTLEEHEVGYDVGALERKKSTGYPFIMDLLKFKTGFERVGEAFFHTFGQFFTGATHATDTDEMARFTKVVNAGADLATYPRSLLDVVEGEIPEELMSLLSSIELLETLPSDQKVEHPCMDEKGALRLPVAPQLFLESLGRVRVSETPFGRKMEMTKLEQERTKLLEHRHALDQQTVEMKSQLERMAQSLSARQIELKDLGAQRVELRSQGMRLKTQLEHSEAQREVLRQQVTDLDERIQTLTAEISKALEVSQEVVHLEEKLQGFQEQIERARAAKQELDGVWIEKRIAFGALEERLDRLRQQTLQTEITQSEYAHNRSMFEADIAAWTQESERENERICANVEQRQTNELEIKRLESALSLSRESLQKVRQDLENFEVERKAVQYERDKTQSAVQALELEHQKLKFEVEELSQLVHERYHCSIQDLIAQLDVATLARLEDEVVLGALEVDAKELRERLEKFGDVNLLAITEQKEIRERLDFMNRQREDLLKTLDALQSIIDRINKITEFRFRETFRAINHNFQVLFPKLFGGGRAHMTLTNENDLLETGVEIFAEPPGKKVQTMSLLSGGEKAMTSISLIFSLFAYRPSSYCILDEVDAPLDEVNTMRYNSIIQEMSALSQFIVITHNKRTMEVTDTLFGVTMQDPGVSQLVGVQLQEAKAFVASA